MKTAAKTIRRRSRPSSKTLTDAKTKAEDKYLALDPYGVAEYTMAAKVRYGDIQYGHAQKIANAPIPMPIVKTSQRTRT